jgi:hypothetical protein
MWRNGVLLTAVLGCGTVLCSCGKSAEPPPRTTLVKGAGALAAPIAPSAPDRGILQDPAQYQPAPFTPPPSKRKEAEPAASKPAADASESARKFALETLEDLQSLKYEDVLERIEPDQTKLLREESAAFLRTQEVLTEAKRVYRDKLGAEAMDQISSAMHKGMAESLQIELVGPATAKATPNPLANLLGPEMASSSANLDQVDGQWHFVLDAPLTGEDVAKVVEYHKNLQFMTQTAITALENGMADPQAVIAQLQQMAAAAQPPAGSQPASGPATGQEPTPRKGGQPTP